MPKYVANVPLWENDRLYQPGENVEGLSKERADFLKQPIGPGKTPLISEIPDPKLEPKRKEENKAVKKDQIEKK